MKFLYPPPENIHTEVDEVDAARNLLRWAEAGDVLVLPIHQSGSRKALSVLLDQMEKEQWRVGAALPATHVENSGMV